MLQIHGLLFNATLKVNLISEYLQVNDRFKTGIQQGLVRNKKEEEHINAVNRNTNKKIDRHRMNGLNTIAI